MTDSVKRSAFSLVKRFCWTTSPPIVGPAYHKRGLCTKPENVSHFDSRPNNAVCYFPQGGFPDAIAPGEEE